MTLTVHLYKYTNLSSRDHSGGNEALKKEYRDLAVYGGSKESVPGATQ